MRTISIIGQYLRKSIFLYRSKFWQLRRKPVVIFSKWLFFKILWRNQVKCSWKIKTVSELFIKQKIEFKLVYFSSPQTLHSAWLNRCKYVSSFYLYFHNVLCKMVIHLFYKHMQIICDNVKLQLESYVIIQIMPDFCLWWISKACRLYNIFPWNQTGNNVWVSEFRSM